MFTHKLINKKYGVLVLPRVDSAEYLQLSEPDIRGESADQAFPIGAALITDDGVFRYAKNGGVAVTIGKLLQQAARAGSDHDANLAVAVVAVVGATSVIITNGSSTAITADMYKDGYLFVNDADGEGAMYKIKSHPAAATTATCAIKLVDPLEVALTTSSEVGLRKNLYDGVIVNPVTPTGSPVGVVNLSSFTANYYGWIKTKGITALLAEGTLVVGMHCKASVTTAGAVTPHNNLTDTNPVIVGIVLVVPGATTEYGLVKIDLDPSW